MIGLDDRSNGRPFVAGLDFETTDVGAIVRGYSEEIAMALYVPAGFWPLDDARGEVVARDIVTTRKDIDPLIDPAFAEALADSR